MLNASNIKTAILVFLALIVAFVTSAALVFGQSLSPSTSSSTIVPSGAPSTGHGG